jgi:hypothetical protein
MWSLWSGSKENLAEWPVRLKTKKIETSWQIKNFVKQRKFIMLDKDNYNTTTQSKTFTISSTVVWKIFFVSYQLIDKSKFGWILFWKPLLHPNVIFNILQPNTCWNLFFVCEISGLPRGHPHRCTQGGEGGGGHLMYPLKYFWKTST